MQNAQYAGLDSVISRAFSYETRASRMEFVATALVMFGLNAAAWLVAAVFHAASDGWDLIFVPGLGLVTILSAIVMVFAGIRRLHDVGYSGAFILLAFIPVLNVAMLILLAVVPSKSPTPAGTEIARPGAL